MPQTILNWNSKNRASIDPALAGVAVDRLSETAADLGMKLAYRFFLAGVIVYAIAAQLVLLPASAQQSVAPPKYVDSKSCVSCHQKEYEDWKGSHHAWALKTPDSSSVLGDFNNSTFLHKGTTSRFYRENGKYFIEQISENKAPKKYQIRYTVGVEPLQQYLVELPGGKLQALDVSWDTKLKTWFHLYPNQTMKAGDGLHWTGPYKNWNARCAVCHQTNFRKNYDPVKGTYDSRWSEATVTCQACHGPAEAHLKWSEKPGQFDMSEWKGVGDRGLVHTFAKQDPQKEIETCAQCHSRRGGLTADSPPPAGRFSDYHRLALLRDGLYFPDGQINDEVYVYGSFLQSKMHKRGVRCSNCHEPHSGSLKAQGNAVCTQCHNPSGNDDFPTLKKREYDDPSHHKHASGSTGAQCVSCHMPAKVFMQVDPRRDHSFRIPRPDLSAKLSTPNACTSCHQDKNNDQVVEDLRNWLVSKRPVEEHYGEIIHAGRSQRTESNRTRLFELALDATKPAIVRATAVSTLQVYPLQGHMGQISALLKDEEDLVRSAALGLLIRLPAPIKVQQAYSLLSDPVRSVRMAAARLFLGVSSRQLAPKQRKSVANAMVEYQKSLFANADFPETQMQLAGIAMTVRQFPAAQRALKTVVDMDPQMVQAWLTLARIQSALGQGPNVVKTLEDGSRSNPGNGEIEFQLGVAYAQTGNHSKAVAALQRSIQVGQTMPTTLELLAVSYLRLDDIKNAKLYAKQLSEKFPDHAPGAVVQQILKFK